MDITKTIRLDPGHYVAAVSGGVDSMVLLDILRQHPNVTITVAHFDHGIRDASHFDRHLVQEVAHSHGLPFVYKEAQLGPGASEDEARKARYEFLRHIQHQSNARGIITAHHLDDSMETAVHNILRGTGRKGMSSLKSVDGIVRPFLHIPKNRLRAYAQQQNLHWTEDETNADTRYRRNYIRHVILPRLREASPQQYNKLKTLIRRQAELNKAIDARLIAILHDQPAATILRRHDVTMLPHAVAAELVTEWLRHRGKRQVNRKLIERLLVNIKTAQPGTELVLDTQSKVQFSKQFVQLVAA
jgi:tRNA(Ile)-lysidine synthase